MGMFTVIPQDTFNDMQVDAGVLLKNFNPASVSAPSDGDIICATTGGISATCSPTYTDWGEDVDNCPNNTKELKQLEGWECRFSATALGTSPEQIRLALGAADLSGATYDATSDTSPVAGKSYYNRTGTSPNYVYTIVAEPASNPSTAGYYELVHGNDTITPRATLSQDDFESSLWWVGDRADGGLVAIELKNVLSTAGFSLQTTKKGKGQFSLELTGHVSINALTTVPMKFYSMEPVTAS